MNAPREKSFLDDNGADECALLRLELSPHEKVIWSGRPRSVNRLITIDEDRDVRFRGRLQTVTIPLNDIVMIRTGEWFDPNRFQAVVRHKRGKLTLINHFSDFADFLATVKELNPSIEIKGV